MISSVYFFCTPQGPPENNPYLHHIIALAEGLQELGIPVYSNLNYWLTNKGYLLTESTVDYHDCDVVFVDAAFYDMNLEHLLPDDVFSKNHKYKLVYNDSSDGLFTNGYRPEIRNANIVLKSHYNSKYNYPSNFVPWQFGLTNRIIQQVGQVPFSARKKEFLNNFRVAHPLRAIAERKVAPVFKKFLTENKETDNINNSGVPAGRDYSYWHQTGRRHYPAYYKRLSHAYACFCFGGNLEKPISAQRNFVEKILYKIDWRIPIFKSDRVYQFDSWRFWESLAAGCCTIHLDFEKYGIVLPVMPVNGKDYLGVDLENIRHLKQQLQQDENIFSTIGIHGQSWAIHHYSPLNTARRFMGLLSS